MPRSGRKEIRAAPRISMTQKSRRRRRRRRRRRGRGRGRGSLLRRRTEHLQKKPRKILLR
jgi:hypothetical protein